MQHAKTFFNILGTIIIGLVILLGILAFFKALSLSPLWTTEGASWVQAFGSIGAILASGIIANWQYRKSAADQEKQRVRDHLVPAVAILTLMRELEFAGNRGRMAIEDIIGAVDFGVIDYDPTAQMREVETSLRAMSDLEASFRAIPLWQLPSPEIVRDLAAVIRFIPRACDDLRWMRDWLDANSLDIRQANQKLELLKLELEVWVIEFEKHVIALGGNPDTGTHFGRISRRSSAPAA